MTPRSRVTLLLAAFAASITAAGWSAGCGDPARIPDASGLPIALAPAADSRPFASPETIDFCDGLDNQSYKATGHNLNDVMVVHSPGGVLLYATLDGQAAADPKVAVVPLAPPPTYQLMWWRYVRGRWPVQSAPSLYVVAGAATLDQVKAAAIAGEKKQTREQIRAAVASVEDFITILHVDGQNVQRAIMVLNDMQQTASFRVYNHADASYVDVTCTKDHPERFVQTNGDGTLDKNVYDLQAGTSLYKLVHDTPNGILYKAAGKHLDTAPYGS